MSKEKCPGKFELSLEQMNIIMDNILEEDKLYDDNVKEWGRSMNDGSGRSCLEKVHDTLEQSPETTREINTAISKATEQIEKEEQILSPEGISLAEKNWQRIKNNSTK